MEQWNNFKGEQWKNSIDVKQFIIDNYTEYLGDESFLSATTEKTDIIMDACNNALKEELDGVNKKMNGILSVLQGNNKD